MIVAWDIMRYCWILLDIDHNYGGDLPDITGNSRYQLHTTRWEAPF